MIKITIKTLDHSTTRRAFAALPAAQSFAQKRLGVTPTIGSGYAVDDYGVATLRVTGASLTDLFPATAPQAPKGGRCTGDPAVLQYGGDCNCRSCVAADDAYEAKQEAAWHADMAAAERAEFDAEVAAFQAKYPPISLQMALIGEEA